jgi:hypothetical protein
MICGELVVSALTNKKLDKLILIWYNMNKLEQQLNELKRSTKKLQQSMVLPNNFDAIEQELINRVIKAVLPQIKSNEDKITAKSILNKTEWING